MNRYKNRRGKRVIHKLSGREGIIKDYCVMMSGPRKGKIAYPQYGGLFLVEFCKGKYEEEICGNDMETIIEDDK